MCVTYFEWHVSSDLTEGAKNARYLLLNRTASFNHTCFWRLFWVWHVTVKGNEKRKYIYEGAASDLILTFIWAHLFYINEPGLFLSIITVANFDIQKQASWARQVSERRQSTWRSWEGPGWSQSSTKWWITGRVWQDNCLQQNQQQEHNDQVTNIHYPDPNHCQWSHKRAYLILVPRGRLSLFSLNSGPTPQLWNEIRTLQFAALQAERSLAQAWQPTRDLTSILPSQDCKPRGGLSPHPQGGLGCIWVRMLQVAQAWLKVKRVCVLFK